MKHSAARWAAGTLTQHTEEVMDEQCVELEVRVGEEPEQGVEFEVTTNAEEGC